MAIKKITELALATSIDPSNIIQIVDITDTSMAPSGTNKKIAAVTLANSFVQIATTVSSIVQSQIDEKADIASPNFTGDINTSGDVYANGELLATKSYVDAISEGLHVHEQSQVILNTSLETITSGSVSYDNGTNGVGAFLTLSNPLTLSGGLDGSTSVVIGSRIIVNAQTPSFRNGIYVVTSTTKLTRASDFDTPTEMAGGDFIFVTTGNTYADTGWVLSEPVTTVGTSPVTFLQFSGAGSITAGDGLTQTGTTINAVGTAGRIVANSNSIDLATAGTAGTYKSVTTDAYGRVTSGTNPTTLSGYGITDAAASIHSHAISDVTGLQTALDTKVDKISTIDTSVTTGTKTFTNSDNGKIFHISGSGTCTIPTWSTLDTFWNVKLVNVGGDALTITRSSTNTINGQTSITNNTQWSSVFIYKSTVSGQFIALFTPANITPMSPAFTAVAPATVQTTFNPATATIDNVIDTLAQLLVKLKQNGLI
jgi:phage-related tail fiber protein